MSQAGHHKSVHNSITNNATYRTVAEYVSHQLIFGKRRRKGHHLPRISYYVYFRFECTLFISIPRALQMAENLPPRIRQIADFNNIGMGCHSAGCGATYEMSKRNEDGRYKVRVAAIRQCRQCTPHTQ